MATGTLNIKLAIANRDAFIKDIESRVSKAVSASLVEGLKQGWAKSADAIQKTLAHEKLEIKFDEKALMKDAVKLANQLRESAKFSVRADFSEAEMKFHSFTEEMRRYRKFSGKMNEKERRASLTRLEVMRKEHKKLSIGLREQANLLLTSTDAEERKQASSILKNLESMERQSAKSMKKMTKGFDEMGDGFDDLESDLVSTRSKARKLYDAVKEKASGFWDAMHSRTAGWIKGLIAAYVSYSAFKTAVVDLIGYQDKLAEAVKGTGVSAGEAWGFMSQAAGVLLDWDEGIRLAGEVAAHGKEAFETLRPLAGTFAKMQLLGVDVSSMTEDFAAMANRYGKDVVPALEDFSQVMFNIENKTVRDKAMGNLLRQSQIMGTSGPKWLASAGRGMVAVSKALEGMGVRSGVITDFMDAVTEFNPFKENQGEWGEMFKTYLSPDEWAEMAAGGEEGYKKSLTAVGRMAEFHKGYFQGTEEDVKLQMAMLSAQEGMSREKVEMMSAYLQGGDTFEQKFGKAMREKVDPKAMEKEYANRQGTIERQLQELKMTWQTILMDLGKQFLPVIQEFSKSLKEFLTGPDFKQFTADLAALTRTTIDTMGPYIKQLMEMMASFLRMVDTVTGGKTMQTGKTGQVTSMGSITSGALKLYGAKKAYDVLSWGSRAMTGKGLARQGARGGGGLLKGVAKGLVGAGRFAAGARTPTYAGAAGKFAKTVDWATKARSVGALGKGATFLGGNTGTGAAAAAAPLAVVAAGAVAAYKINKSAQEAKAAVEVSEKAKEKLFTSREENFMRAIKLIKANQSLTEEQKKNKIQSLTEAMHEKEPDKSVFSWAGWKSGMKEMFTKKESGKTEEEEAKKTAKTEGVTFSDKVGKFISGLFTSTNETMETVAKDSSKDLKESVTKSAMSSFEMIHGIWGRSSGWDAVQAGVQEGIVDQLPTFQSAVFESATETMNLVKETFNQIFATGQTELKRLKDATAGYSAGPETAPSTSASVTAGGGGVGVTPAASTGMETAAIPDLTSYEGLTGVHKFVDWLGGRNEPGAKQIAGEFSGLTASDWTAGGKAASVFERVAASPAGGALQTLGAAFMNSPEGAGVILPAPTTAGPGASVAGAGAAVAPAAATMPVAGANADMTVAEGLKASSLEERLLARAVTYLGGIFTNTASQGGLMRDMKNKGTYQRMLEAVRGDLERLAGGAE